MNRPIGPGVLQDVRRTVWRDRFRAVRDYSVALAAPLCAEDQQIQSMPDVSPRSGIWRTSPGSSRPSCCCRICPATSCTISASASSTIPYYEAVGERCPRDRRGLISRPSVDEVIAYRAHVDAGMDRLVEQASAAVWNAIVPLLELGLHHEQQHQELTLMDIKHVLSCNPLQPAYLPADVRTPDPVAVSAIWDTRAGCTRSATPAKALRSTTRHRATACGWTGSNWQTAW